MIRRSKQFNVQIESNLKGGTGTVTIENLLMPDEMYGAGRLCGITIIPPHASIGRHTHTGEFEIYYILQGMAKVDDNGNEEILEAGDMICCKDGDYHAIRNIGETDLKYVAVIFFCKNKTGHS